MVKSRRIMRTPTSSYLGSLPMSVLLPTEPHVSGTFHDDFKTSVNEADFNDTFRFIRCPRQEFFQGIGVERRRERWQFEDVRVLDH